MRLKMDRKQQDSNEKGKRGSEWAGCNVASNGSGATQLGMDKERGGMWLGMGSDRG
jgi:hypothetical protein